jgi:hypothetical protein
MSNYVDIGHGVSIELRHLPGETKPAGVAYKHPNGKGGECEGWVPFGLQPGVGYEGTPEHHGWEVVSLEPLTLSPSLLCRLCGHHCYIKEGKCVPV